MREFSASDLRNLICAFNFIERDEIFREIPRIADLTVDDFMDNPIRIFLKMDDERQDAIARIVNRKMVRA